MKQMGARIVLALKYSVKDLPLNNAVRYATNQKNLLGSKLLG